MMEKNEGMRRLLGEFVEVFGPIIEDMDQEASVLRSMGKEAELKDDWKDMSLVHRKAKKLLGLYEHRKKSEEANS